MKLLKVCVYKILTKATLHVTNITLRILPYDKINLDTYIYFVHNL